MRNLKRALSLTLASVMLLGMMVVGSSALSFNDADDISNVTAASVLEDLGIMQGDGSGNFMPDKAVTRAQMAIIVCRILYGNKLNVSQFEGTTQYTDVGANDYYTGYINLATQLGIIGGYGDGRFGPNDTVTTAQAALMLSRALGYFKGSEIAQATDWALASIAQATKINMFGNLNLPTNAELARDNVAEMVFNAITKTVPVQYNELLGVYYNENQGIIYSLEFNYLQTLGYKNFDLVYKSDTRDMYGRPATTWGVGRYNAGNSTTSSGTITKTDQLTTDGGLKPSLVRLQEKDEIITVPNAATYVYTDKTKEKDVYSDLGKTVCTDTTKDKDRGYTWIAYVNGKEVEEKVAGKDGKDLIPKSGTAGDKRYIYTAKGTQTEIYIDDDEQTVDVIEINYYIGQVSSVKEDKGGRYVTVKELSTGSSLNERTFYTGSYAEDDYVIYTMDYVEDDKDYVIAEMFEPEVVTGEINRVEKDKDDSDTYLRFEQDGTKYPYSFQYQGSTKNGESHQSHMVYDLDELNNPVHPALKTDYDLLLDPNGYVVAFREANQKPNQYLYVKDSDEELKDWVAKVLLTDTTSAKVEVKDELDNLNDSGTETWDHPQKDGATGKAVNAKIDWVGYELDNNFDDKVSNIDGMIWKYSVNDSGVYTLKFIDPQKTWSNTKDEDTQWYMTNAKIQTGKAYVEGTRTGDKTVNEFIVDAKTVFVDDVNDKVYTGYKEVPNVDNARVAYVLNKGVAKVVFILEGEIYDSSNVFFMLKNTDRETFKYDGDNYWDFDNAYINGERQSHFYVRTNALNGGANDKLNLKAGHLYEVKKTIEDGEYVTKIEEWTDSNNKALPQALLTINAVGDETFWLNQYNENTVYKYDTVDGDDPTQIVLVEYDADGKLDNITTGRLSDMKNGLETVKNKETQKDSEGNTVTMDTWAVVVKAKGSTGKDATTARVVYIVNRPVEFFYKDANDKTQTGYYDYNVAVEDGKFAVTVNAPTLADGEVINEIIIRDADGKIIDRITKNIPEIVNGDITLVVPEDAAEIEFVTGEYVPPVDPTKAAITVNFDAGVESVEIDGKTYSTSGSKVQVTKGEATDMTINLKKNFEIKSVDGATKKSETVYTINVSEDGAVTITTIDASVKTLTLKDPQATATLVAEVGGANSKATIYSGNKPVAVTEIEGLLDGATATYGVEPGQKVTIKGAAALSGITTAGSYIVDGVVLTVSDSGKQIEFVMPKDDYAITLKSDGSAFVAKDGKTEVSSAVFAVHVGEGLTAVGSDADNAAKIIMVDEQMYVQSGTTLKVTGDRFGEFAVANKDDISVATASAKADGATTAAITAEVYLKPVATVTITDDSGDTVELFAAASGGTKFTTASNTIDIVKNSTVYVAPATGKGSAVLVGAAADDVKVETTALVGTSTERASYQVTGATFMAGAFKLELDTNVKATINTVDYTGTVYAANKSAVTLAVTGENAANEVVVEKVNENTWYGASVSSVASLAADKAYIALTKVTLKAGSGSAQVIEKLTYGDQDIFDNVKIADGNTTDVVVGVAAGHKVTVWGNTKNAAKTITLTGVEAEKAVDGTTDTNDQAYAIFTVGTAAIEAIEANPS